MRKDKATWAIVVSAVVATLVSYEAITISASVAAERRSYSASLTDRVVCEWTGTADAGVIYGPAEGQTGTTFRPTYTFTSTVTTTTEATTVSGYETTQTISTTTMTCTWK